MRKLIPEDQVEKFHCDLPSSPKFVSKVGLSWGYLTVHKFAGYNARGKTKYFCKCICNNFVIVDVSNMSPSKTSKKSEDSCGCMMGKSFLKPLSEMISRVKKNVPFEILECSTYWSSKWKLRCKEHGDFIVNYSTLQRECVACPGCTVYGYNPKKPGTFYINAVYSKDGLVCYKYGITNKSVETRLKQLKQNSDYQVANVFSYSNEDGSVVKELETFVKNNTKGNYLDKNNFRDGFTETIPPVQIIDLYCLLNIIFKEN